ncbi:transcription-repair coupling factor [Neptunicella marina]|uniref:Transcription-repair-coupling factor n=1 Tax=Neptunicella marina TaxID=2125989 RepID=A0A8J6M3H1_9ALTE|nr:transcription-repair coupling factor [Neptunicella marina]MBC3767017.1 transcription-repair coupling factor [Neptunicella marina]
MSINILQPELPATKGDHQYWGNLQGSSVALAIAQTAKTANSQILVVSADTPSAIKLQQELAYFLKPSALEVKVFPDWETLPYDNFSPHQDIVSQRLETLFRLTQKQSGIFVVPVNTLLMRLAPVDFLSQYLLILNRGETLDIEAFRTNLQKAGYHAVNQVMEHGEFSIRGSIIDIYPMGSELPFRIDLFDDEIDTIRLFDPETQRGGDKVDNIRLLPAHEFPTDKQALNLFRDQYSTLFEPSNAKESLFYQVSKGVMPAGIEYYLPLFFEQTATLFDYLHQDTLIVNMGDLKPSIEFYWQDLQERYEQHRYNPMRPLLPPDKLFLRKEELFAQYKGWPRISLSKTQIDAKAGRHNFTTSLAGDIAVKPQSKVPTASIKQAVSDWQQQGYKILFCAETQGRRESLLELLKKAGIKPKEFADLDSFLAGNAAIGISISWAEHSFLLHQDNCKLAFITETELLGHRISQRRLRDKRQATDENAIIRNLAELAIGQPVVHLDHGVGRYLGLQTLDAGGVSTEYLCIEYARQAKLYVPVASLHLISRYTGGDNEHAPIHQLGSDTWAKAKSKAAEKVRDVAAQLLDVYAQRAAKPGYAYPVNWDEYRSFADSFAFEETADQQQAINAVLNDLGSPSAMDRLVCGDVGFGKTEVAMRAAFIAANGGRQVAVLVPTTLLAQQHFENFRDRFANWPFRIEVMSRFRTAKEQKASLEALAEGKVDILVGTHKLLQDDVKFNNLGLVIIDEEHRFGVRQKEKFKSLRAEVDILTLTATPIPRTLNMAFSGMRDLSIIATPPAKRLAIKTFVNQKEKQLIREAIMREILRGGQVYYLHNEVESIDKTAQELSEIVPEARIAIGHGQMREKELERVMSDFYHQRFNLLVCTTIIETGIDVPSANTIIIDRADHLGLAQLHQLRGRVGRSHHQAYAYLLTPHPKRITKDAKKRLEAIAEAEDLGSGFTLATHDLEIRGAGELLGDGQSGQIASVGFSLYMEMLEQAVNALKDGKEPSLETVMSTQAEIDLRLPTLLPEDYIADVNIRLSMYKKIASAKNSEELEELQVELIDRFGLLPQATKYLFKISELKQVAQRIGIKKVDANERGGIIEFNEVTKVDPSYIIKLIQTRSDTFKLDGPQKLRLQFELAEQQKRLDFISKVLMDLAQHLQADPS